MRRCLVLNNKKRKVIHILPFINCILALSLLVMQLHVFKIGAKEIFSFIFWISRQTFLIEQNGMMSIRSRNSIHALAVSVTGRGRLDDLEVRHFPLDRKHLCRTDHRHQPVCLQHRQQSSGPALIGSYIEN